jgi:cell division protein FtsW (lipid II flippase)
MLPSIQPAEIAKLTLLMFLAAIFSGEKRVDVNPQFFSIGAGLALLSALMSIVFGQPLLGGVVSLAAIYFIYRFGGVAKNLYEGLGVFSAILLAVVGLVAAQPDWGTSLIMVCMSVGLFFVAGAKLKYFAVSGIVAAGALTPIVMSKQYIADRFSAFLNPTADVLGAGYHLYQSLLAIGSGGFFGLGFGFSRQKYEYLPEAHADSIFAVIGEEVGFFGITLMIVAFGVFAYRGLRIAFGAEDRYAMLLSSGIVTWIVMQAVINMMVNVGLLPNTGVPIPFISQGGSSIMAILAAVGVLLNISKFSDYSARSGNGLFQGSRFLRVIKRWR